MSVFTSFSGGKLDLTLSSTPTIINLAMPLAATEYSVTIPAGTRQFLIRTRSGIKLNLAYILGNSGTTYIEVPRNCFYAESDVSLQAAQDLYIQTAAASQVLEILIWQ